MTNNKKSVQNFSKQTKEELSFPLNVKGLDISKEIKLEDLICAYETTGYQATNLYKATQIINSMQNTKIYFGCTSNIISSGLRDIICNIVKNKLIDVLVITGGGIEEDIIKTILPTKIGSFDIPGTELRTNGFNRIGNLIIHNENYFEFEKWLTEFLDELLKNYSPQNPLILTPSKFINLMGKKINNQSSILFWAYKNEIPIFSLALTDGSIGDVLTFYNNRESLKLDIVEDIYNINFTSMFVKQTSAIILGGGLIKHQILNANLFKDGLNNCVIVSTAMDYDGSDAGANIQEAMSWGKINEKNKSIKVVGDATIIFPLLVSGTFLGGKERKNN